MPKKQVKKLVIKENTPNPVAKSLRSSHLKTQIIPSKKIYNRKRLTKLRIRCNHFDMVGYGWRVYIKGCILE